MEFTVLMGKWQFYVLWKNQGGKMGVVVIAIWKSFFNSTFQKYVWGMFPTGNIWIVKMRANHIKDPEEDLQVVGVTHIKILKLTQLGCLQEQHRVCETRVSYS